MSKTARILLVEDDATFRSLLAAILDDEGYELVEREDGKAALKTLQGQSFDLVLSDLRLPGLNGLDLFRRAQAEGIAPPFILLTAFGTVEEAVAAMKEGVADFLTKPLKDPDTLRTLVRRVLAGSADRERKPVTRISPVIAGSQYGTCYLRGGDMRMSPHFLCQKIARRP